MHHLFVLDCKIPVSKANFFEHFKIFILSSLFFGMSMSATELVSKKSCQISWYWDLCMAQGRPCNVQNWSHDSPDVQRNTLHKPANMQPAAKTIDIVMNTTAM